MSVTIYYRMVSKTDPHFNAGTSSDLSVLESHFGGALEEKDIPALRAMAAIEGHGFFDEVADTIERVGSIEVYGRW